MYYDDLACCRQLDRFPHFVKKYYGFDDKPAGHALNMLCAISPLRRIVHTLLNFIGVKHVKYRCG